MTTAATMHFECFDDFDTYAHLLYREIVKQFRESPVPGFAIDSEPMIDSLYFTHDDLPVYIYASPVFHDRVNGSVPKDFTEINISIVDDQRDFMSFDAHAIDIQATWAMTQIRQNAEKYLRVIKQQLLAMYNMYIVLKPRIQTRDVTDDDELTLYANDGSFLTLIEAGLENNDHDTVQAAQYDYYLEEGGSSAH